ncbi:MAG: aldehyde:ferredoxin oxidoreductase [Planctomycetota bacterium]|jgi:aldehyde:ferredoxin oxidoreductase|nr:aldehyde:ferredoxin oxidoreductase [Planctomycetota bacterium]
MISDTDGNRAAKKPQDFRIRSFQIDLTAQAVTPETVQCEDLEDALGGIARGFKLLEKCPTDTPYDPSATLILNLGILSGTDFMTGLRTYFHGYSPLKSSLSGRPSAMWSAGSGKFGTKLRHLDVDEIVFTGRCEKPTLLRIHRDTEDGPVQFSFEDASDLVGMQVNPKILKLHEKFPNAHFAVIGPSGENYENCRYAAIALSTENQLKSKDNKPRFCGRGGMGGVMGSKNLIAIVADTKDRIGPKAPPELKELNQEVAKGKGSAKFRDKDKFGGGGGTWANYDALNPVHAMPEMNFVPTGTRVSLPLFRDNWEQGPYVVKDESCFRCGISCHKNVYDEDENGKAGKFRAKLDFEPLNLLSSNVGIFEPDECLELCEVVDQYCMDSISVGTTLSYAMEYNRRNPDKMIAHGVTYGDYKTAHKVLEEIGQGKLPELGQGTLRLSKELGAPEFAMQSKGMEYAAYLPQTNPGYPWALAGGHMSMKTYLLLLVEKETGMDYWVDAITNRGLAILRDDFLGVCKFSGMSDENMAKAITALTGLAVSVEEIQKTIRRVFLRGYRLELRQGFTDADYTMPEEAHDEYPQIQLPHFNSREFFGELKQKVQSRLGEMLVEEGLPV